MKKPFKKLSVILAACLLFSMVGGVLFTQPAQAATGTQGQPFIGKDHILITAFGLPTAAYTNAQQYQMLEDAGFNYLQNVGSSDTTSKALNLQMAQLAYDHNMQLGVSDSRLAGISSLTAAQIKSVVSEYDGVPGVGGVYVIDEPTQGTAASLYGPVFQAIKAQAPGLYAHINFLPSSVYASEATFQTDLTSFVSAAGAGNVDYIMYDRYSFPDNGTGSCDYNGMMSNLNSLWLAGTQTGVKTGFYLQVAGIQGMNARTNANELRFQIYSALGFGVKQLSYFTYWSVGAYNFSNGIIDVNGNPTDLYAPVSELNSEVNHLSSTLINLNADKVYFSGANTYGMTRVPTDFLAHPLDGHNMMYSLMVDKNDGTQYLMIVNTDYNNSVTASVQMNTSAVGSMEEVLHTTGQLSGTNLLANGDTVSLNFLPGEGRLFRLGSPVVNLSNTPVTTDDSSASVTYTGSWSTWNDAWDYRTTEHNSSVTGDTVQYNFTGSSIKWIGAKYYTYGNADVYIDGAFIGTVDCYSPTKLYQQVLFSKTGLSNASHTIKIVVKGTKNVSSSGYNVGIDAFTSRFDYTPAFTDDSSASVAYNGSWSTWNDASDYLTTEHNSNVTGDFVQYTFTGTSVEWIGAKFNTYGNADVYIDGSYAGTVDCYNSSKLCQQILFRETGLSNTSHTIKIVVKGTKNDSSSGYYVDIDAFTSGYATISAITDDCTAEIGYYGYWPAWNDPSDYMTTEHNNNVAGSYVQYSFTGSSIEWIGAKYNTYGSADVYIDGNYVGSVDCYNSSKLCQQVLFSRAGLAYGPHSISVYVYGPKNPRSTDYYVDIDAFIVT